MAPDLKELKVYYGMKYLRVKPLFGFIKCDWQIAYGENLPPATHICEPLVCTAKSHFVSPLGLAPFSCYLSTKRQQRYQFRRLFSVLRNVQQC